MRTKTIQLVALALTFFSSPVFPATPHLRRSYKDTHSRTTAAVSPAAASFELHQHHVVREYHDTCAYIDADVLDNVSILGISLGLDVDICICISLLPLIISANVELEALVPLVGLNDLIAKLGVVVNDSPNGQHCTYPDHAYAICSQGNPCGFGCEPPYVVDDGQCVCPPPLSSCNGVCGSFPHGCGSSGPKSWSRRSGGPVQRRIDSGSGITTFADAQATCKMNETVCGVYGSSVTGFECLDTDTQLESCTYNLHRVRAYINTSN
ncbi:hypothetical protein B0H21DRAFT_776466 [Amylocystis lapponica]|nr:hypothetical protein B0H21DRAFT_776466 [Amylocystis lapponica]